MAKGNMFQGMARGKVGDVVFSRLNGEQISRVRNRNPRNPKSNGQLYQRAIMATVMAAYSAGKEIFDHSFQNVPVGSGCQRAFLRENANALRAQLASEINNKAVSEEALAKVTAPGIQVPVPNLYIISKGTYDQKVFTISSEDLYLSEPQANETYQQYYNRIGLIAGDIYTVVFILTNKNNTLFSALGIESVSFDQLKAANFGYIRMIVKQPTNPKAVMANNTYDDIFEFQAGGIGDTTSMTTRDHALADSLGINDFVSTNDYVNGSGYAWGVIRSRLDEDLRSNTKMTVVNPSEFGIVYSSLLDAWKQGVQSLGDSELILEGGDE